MARKAKKVSVEARMDRLEKLILTLVDGAESPGEEQDMKTLKKSRRSKGKKRQEKPKGHWDKLKKRAEALKRQLEKWGYTVSKKNAKTGKVNRTTWRVYDLDGEDVGVIKPTWEGTQLQEVYYENGCKKYADCEADAFKP